MQKPTDMELLNQKSELLKAIAHPVRLCIVRGLMVEGECNVNKMQTCLEMPQSTVSQHLGKLRDLGIISARRDGVEVFYRLVDEDIKKVVGVLFQGL